MTEANLLVICGAIIAAALGTYGFRVSFVFLFGYLEEVPLRVDRALQFIPPAVISDSQRSGRRSRAPPS